MTVNPYLENDLQNTLYKVMALHFKIDEKIPQKCLRTILLTFYSYCSK